MKFNFYGRDGFVDLMVLKYFIGDISVFGSILLVNLDWELKFIWDCFYD